VKEMSAFGNTELVGAEVDLVGVGADKEIAGANKN
jgi:hypothetical protein